MVNCPILSSLKVSGAIPFHLHSASACILLVCAYFFFEHRKALKVTYLVVICRANSIIADMLEMKDVSDSNQDVVQV